MQRLADEELVAAYRADSTSRHGRDSLDELFERYRVRVALWCYRLTGDREWAADLAQEVFLKAFRNMESFRGEAKFSTWLYTIARNHCFNELKSRAVRPGEGAEELPLDLAAAGDDAFQALDRQDSVRFLHRLLKENLTEPEIQVMTLHYGEDVPLDAIGRLLQLQNASGAKAYIVSARRKLNRVLEQWRASGRGASRREQL